MAGGKSCPAGDQVPSETGCQDAAAAVGRGYVGTTFSPYANQYDRSSPAPPPAARGGGWGGEYTKPFYAPGRTAFAAIFAAECKCRRAEGFGGKSGSSQAQVVTSTYLVCLWAFNFGAEVECSRLQWAKLHWEASAGMLLGQFGPGALQREHGFGWNQQHKY